MRLVAGDICGLLGRSLSVSGTGWTLPLYFVRKVFYLEGLSPDFGMGWGVPTPDGSLLLVKCERPADGRAESLLYVLIIAGVSSFDWETLYVWVGFVLSLSG